MRATLFAVAVAALLCFAGSALAQEKPYQEGSVWSVGTAKVKPGLNYQYMRELGASYNKIMAEAKKEGLILSYKILYGNDANRDDWNILFLIEYKNWAALDGLTDKFDVISKKIIGSEDTQTQMMVKRTDIREIIGNKLMQEVTLK